LYLSDGSQRRGASHRCAFWDGYNGLQRSANVIPNTMSSAAFQAGKEFAARQRKLQKKGSTAMTTTPAPASVGKIEVQLFDKPSNDLRGTVIAMQSFKGKEKRIAHAYVTLSGVEKVSVTLPSTLSVDDTHAAAETLMQFVAKLKEVTAPEPT
jgi:hypothetical protein